MSYENNSQSDSDSYLDDELLDEMDEYPEQEPCVNGNSYLACYEYFPEINDILLMSKIPLKLFYDFDYQNVQRYIYWYSGTYISDTNVNIIKVKIVNNYVIAIIKTFWIRLIQRTWRRIYKERQQYIANQTRNVLQNIRSRELGRMPTEKYPELRGMLQNI